MSRNTAAVESASQVSTLRYTILADVNSLSAPVHVCTGGNFVYTGTNTYTPIGGMANLDPVQEGADVFARSVRIQLAAVNTSQIADLTAENLFNKQVVLWRCFLDTQKLTMVDTPQLLFKGRINTANLIISDPQKGNYYEIEVESRLKQNPKALYYNRQTLQIAMGSSGDTFFDQIVNIPMFIGEWGKIPTYYGGGAIRGPDPGGGPSGGGFGGGGGAGGPGPIGLIRPS